MIIKMEPGEIASYPVPGYFFYYNRGEGEIRVTLFDDEGSQEVPAVLLPGQGIDSRTRFDRFEIENLHGEEQELNLEIRRSRFVDNRTSNKLTVVTNDGEPLKTEFAAGQLPLPVELSGASSGPLPVVVQGGAEPESYWITDKVSAGQGYYLKAGIKAIAGETPGFVGLNVVRFEMVFVGARGDTTSNQFPGLMLRYGVSNNFMSTRSPLRDKADYASTIPDMASASMGEIALDSQLVMPHFCDYLKTTPDGLSEVYKPAVLVGQNDAPVFVPAGYAFTVQSEAEYTEINFVAEVQPVFS